MAVERGLFPGPRMRVAVSVLSQTGGHGDGFMSYCVDLHESRPNDVPSGVMDGVEAMRHNVIDEQRAGDDCSKCRASGGVLSPGDSPDSAQFTVDEIAVAVYEAAAQ